MAGFIELNELVKKLNHKHMHTWLDSLTFPYILLIWIVIIITFGFVYYAFSSGSSYLYYITAQAPIQNVEDAAYFSFVAATTTGFGDIIPFGYFKLVAVLEVISGWLLLALVTSKFVSIKQDIILNELYEWSLTEKVNRIRNSFILFRQNLERVIAKVEDKTIQKRELNNFYLLFSSFEDALNELLLLLSRRDDEIVRDLDSVQLNLLSNSILLSFDKIREAVSQVKPLEWNPDLTFDIIKRCIAVNDKIFYQLNVSRQLSKQSLSDINDRREKIIKSISSLLNK